MGAEVVLDSCWHGLGLVGREAGRRKLKDELCESLILFELVNRTGDRSVVKQSIASSPLQKRVVVRIDWHRAKRNRHPFLLLLSAAQSIEGLLLLRQRCVRNATRNHGNGIEPVLRRESSYDATWGGDFLGRIRFKAERVKSCCGGVESCGEADKEILVCDQRSERVGLVFLGVGDICDGGHLSDEVGYI